MGNQNPSIEEQQTTQWKSTKGQTSTKHRLKTNDRVTRTSLKTGGELRFSRRVTDTRGEIDTLLYD